MKHTLKSITIESIEWEDRVLTVFFKSGKIIEYYDVPQGIAIGIANYPSPGFYFRRYINKEFSTNKTKIEDDKKELKRLHHYKESTRGLWTTDRPDLIPKEIKMLFTPLKY